MSALKIRVLKVLHIGAFKYFNSCPLLFHRYTYSIGFWDYPKWGYNSKFGLTLIMSPLLLNYKSSFLFQNVGHSHDALCMCKIVRDSVTCIVKLMDDLNIFCKMYLGNRPIFTFSLFQLKNSKIIHLYGLQIFIQFIKISMVLLRIPFIWFLKIDFHWIWQEDRVIPDPMIVGAYWSDIAKARCCSSISKSV
jgi:hypothetical protein